MLIINRGQGNLPPPSLSFNCEIMLRSQHHRGEAALEYIIVGAIVITVLGAALYAVAQSVALKLEAINVDLGS